MISSKTEPILGMSAVTDIVTMAGSLAVVTKAESDLTTNLLDMDMLLHRHLVLRTMVGLEEIDQHAMTDLVIVLVMDLAVTIELPTASIREQTMDMLIARNRTDLVRSMARRKDHIRMIRERAELIVWPHQDHKLNFEVASILDERRIARSQVAEACRERSMVHQEVQMAGSEDTRRRSKALILPRDDAVDDHRMLLRSCNRAMQSMAKTSSYHCATRTRAHLLEQNLLFLHQQAMEWVSIHGVLVASAWK